MESPNQNQSTLTETLGSENPETIFLVIHSGFAARYLLRTEILPVMKQAGIRIVILTPNAEEDYFQKEFSAPGIHIEKLQSDSCSKYLRGSKVQQLFRRIRMQTQGQPEKNRSIEITRTLLRDSARTRNPAKWLVLKLETLLVNLLSRINILRSLLIWLESKLFTGHFHRSLFEKYAPEVVVTTSLGYWHPEEYLMREAKYHGATVIPVVLSWDNTSSYGMAAVRPDHVIAWTDTMKDELITYHDMISENVYVGGVAHFDLYHHIEGLMSREKLCHLLGLDMKRKILFFATKSPNTYPWNLDIVELIGHAIDTNQFVDECQLVVRLHPIYGRYRDGKRVYQDEIARYEGLQERFPFIAINEPRVLSSTLSLDSSRDEMILLGSLLHQASVLINLFSTVAIEASIFDLPMINVAYEGDPRLKQKLRYSISLDEAQAHNQRVVQTGGIRMARSPEALIDMINVYLSDSSIDREGRQRIRLNECGPNPGTAGKRIGRFLASHFHRQ